MSLEIHKRIQRNDSEKGKVLTKRYKIAIVGILIILIFLTIWESYLIVNGALTSIKNPLSNNILDNVGILYILWFVGVFLALAYKMDILFGNKDEHSDEKKEESIKKPKSLKKYIFTAISIFILVPIISAVSIYYIIYYIIFLFLGILPYIVGVIIVAGLIYSLITLPKLAYKPKRGRKIIVFSVLMILCYSFVLLLTNGYKPKATVDMSKQKKEIFNN